MKYTYNGIVARVLHDSASVWCSIIHGIFTRQMAPHTLARISTQSTVCAYLRFDALPAPHRSTSHILCRTSQGTRTSLLVENIEYVSGN